MSENQKVFYSIGLMSGTSLDGVDLVYCTLQQTQGTYSYEILNSKTIPYSEEWIEKLKTAFTQSKEELELLDVIYGNYLGNLTNQFIEEFSIEKIDFIASHGHTIFHKPEEKYTLQIGCGKEIAKITNCKVVYDFRSQDVALEGQGAPLVPIGDQLLFSEYDACLNLGGFANISFDERGKRKAFDVCPVNIVMNYYANKINLPYDDKGQLASLGNVNKELLYELNSDAFYNSQSPKSLGYEFVVSSVLPLIENYSLEINDVLRTYVEHISIQVSKILEKSNVQKILITGGGAYNTFLIERIRYHSKVIVVIPDKEVVEFKEALIFSLLGLLKIEGKVNCLKSVTGAKKDHSSGEIVYP